MNSGLYFFHFSNLSLSCFFLKKYSTFLSRSLDYLRLCCYCSVAKLCPTLRPHELQHTWFPCPSLSPEVCSNSCPLSQWCHPTMSSVVPFSSCPQSFLASGSFSVSQLFASGGQRMVIIIILKDLTEVSRLVQDPGSRSRSCDLNSNALSLYQLRWQ